MTLLDLKVKFHKLYHWEYWSTRTIYTPVFFVWLYLAIRNRNWFFFNDANPSFDYGGFVMCSKKVIYDLIPEQWIPKTLLFKSDTSFELIQDQLNFPYPLILKPNIGLKGLGVEIVHSEIELKQLISEIDYDFLIQEKIPHNKEVGVFYYRYPDAEKGHCSGMVKKDFLSITGNGKDQLKTLILNHPRAFIHNKILFEIWKEQLDHIPELDEKITLVPFGSHTRGAAFYDISEQLTPALCQQIDEICQNIPGFYYGRLDIMYSDFEQLKEGKAFQIVEINGAASEPTHMYDPKHSYLFALKELSKHWRIMARIAKTNTIKQTSKYSNIQTSSAIAQNIRLETQFKKQMGLK